VHCQISFRMKSEDKIIELLAQYQKKTDQLLDRMDSTDRSVEIMSRALVEHSTKFNSVSQEIKSINQEIKHMREEQGIVLSELLSISRRVASIEDRR
jgi:uncharacterized coiled-coil DUF342 family protein